MTVCMSLLFNTECLNAATVSSAKNITESNVKSENISVLTNRLNEIKTIATDKSRLTAVEKKALRNEVLIIKKEVLNHPIIISAGALILIIILLILLL